MSKKDFKGDTSLLLGGESSSKKTNEKVKTSGGVATKTSKKGTKENETRATFIVNEEILEKVKAISKLEGAKIKDVIGEALTRFVETYEKKKGAIDSEKVLTKSSIL